MIHSNHMQRGKLIIIVGPTGSGKGTLIAHARTLHPELALSISCTTRAPRPGEAEGDHYHFLSREEFEQRINAGDFLEWAVYGDNYYGTPKEGVMDHIERGESVILEIEVQGARQVKACMPPEDVFTIYIDAGSWEALESRVRARAPISDEEIAKRRSRYEDETSFKGEVDVVVTNEDGKLEEAKARFVEAIESALRG